MRQQISTLETEWQEDFSHWQHVLYLGFIVSLQSGAALITMPRSSEIGPIYRSVRGGWPIYDGMRCKPTSMLRYHCIALFDHACIHFREALGYKLDFKVFSNSIWWPNSMGANRHNHPIIISHTFGPSSHYTDPGVVGRRWRLSSEKILTV